MKENTILLEDLVDLGYVINVASGLTYSSDYKKAEVGVDALSEILWWNEEEAGTDIEAEDFFRLVDAFLYENWSEISKHITFE